MEEKDWEKVQFHINDKQIDIVPMQYENSKIELIINIKRPMVEINKLIDLIISNGGDIKCSDILSSDETIIIESIPKEYKTNDIVRIEGFTLK